MLSGWFAPDNGQKYSFMTRWLGGPFALFIVVLAVVDLPESIHASHNEGVRGVFTSERADCSGRGGCTYFGRFVSDDGSLDLDEVFIDSGAGKVGVTVDAQYFQNSRTSDKVYELGSRDWVWVLLFLAGGVPYFCWWSWNVVIQPLRSRRSQ